VPATGAREADRVRVRRLFASTVAVGLALAGCNASGGSSGGSGGAGAFSIAIWGDTPYSPVEAAAVPTLIDQVNASDVRYTIFVGDLTGGRCDNGTFTQATDRFDSFTRPMLYVPGDNEWTDCHTTAQDPIERLAYLRHKMFATNHTFGKNTFTVLQQPGYPENARWETNSVVFASLNVPGSNDNHVADPDAPEEGTPRESADRRAAEAEYRTRDQADRDWLHETFEDAARSGAKAVVVAMQADPGFDVAPATRATRHLDGFDPLLAAVASEARAFARPVVILHGDSHRYRVDHPLLDPATGQPIPNLTRVESFGSPSVGWVRVTFDPADPAFVSVQPHLVAGPGNGD
jgi:hypothetical protein